MSTSNMGGILTQGRQIITESLALTYTGNLWGLTEAVRRYRIRPWTYSLSPQKNSTNEFGYFTNEAMGLRPIVHL